MSDYDKLKSLLKGKSGDEAIILFQISGFPHEEDIEAVLKNGKGIEITRADVTNPKTAPIMDNNVSSSSSGTGDCEQFCTDYEAFADEYVAFMKKYKANPTDLSIMSEYSEMVQKASDMQDHTKDCMGDSKVAARISKALARIAKAVM